MVCGSLARHLVSDRQPRQSRQSSGAQSTASACSVTSDLKTPRRTVPLCCLCSGGNSVAPRSVSWSVSQTRWNHRPFRVARRLALTARCTVHPGSQRCITG